MVRGGGRCCLLVWSEKPQKQGIDCLVKYHSLSFLIFVDDTAEAWGGVAIFPKPDIYLRGKEFIEHCCVSQYLVLKARLALPLAC